MRFRGVLPMLFLLPLAWGLITLGSGRSVPVAPKCPGLQLDEVGEEHPGRMRPGFTCAVGYDNATGPYLEGAGYLAYPAVGLALLAANGPLRLPWRRTGDSTDITGA